MAMKLRRSKRPAWNPDTDAYVWVDPGRQGGAPCIGGTRIPTDMVPGYVKHSGVDGMAHDYDLTPRQIVTALWYEAMHGRWSRVKKLRRWAEDAGMVLWHSEVETLPELPEAWR